MTRLGRLVGGRYRLGLVLGSGSAGTVHRAADLRGGRDVAVKLLHPELAHDPAVRARFLGEAIAARRISHPNVVQVYGHGGSNDEDDLPWMAMELCDGETLDVVIGTRGAVGAPYACELAVQVLAGLAAAHSLGIVHRDLKPGNISVVHPLPDVPVAKVLDFGIAKGVRGEEHDPEERGRLFGTPNYMAPEQAVGGPVDARSDLYAVGAILYELLSGRPPFAGATHTEVLAKVLTRPPMPLRAFDRSLPPELEALVRRALAKDADDRPASAVELARSLQPFLPTRERLPSVRALVPSDAPLPLVARSAEAIPRSPRRPALALVTDSERPPAPVTTSRSLVLVEGSHDSDSEWPPPER
ncbi:MAG: serine/threonine protein kinase [Polyangiaceae bacterium]|nr:serine/threonine protein kinase [Polyangiaceae bacterium]